LEKDWIQTACGPGIGRPGSEFFFIPGRVVYSEARAGIRLKASATAFQDYEYAKMLKTRAKPPTSDFGL